MDNNNDNEKEANIGNEKGHHRNNNDQNHTQFDLVPLKDEKDVLIVWIHFLIRVQLDFLNPFESCFMSKTTTSSSNRGD